MQELQKFDPIVTEVTSITETAKNLIVASTEGAKEARDLAKDWRDRKIAADNLRKEIIKDSQDFVTKVNEYVRENITKPVDAGINEVKKRVGAYESEQERLRREELAKREAEKRRLEAEAEKLRGSKKIIAETKAVQAAEQAAELEAQKVTGGGRKHFTFRLASFAAVPDAYKALDESAVRAAIAAGVREIPGLEIIEERKVVLR